MAANEIRLAQRIVSEKTMCPPSSWPIGSRFKAVAKMPTQAARAIG